VTTAKIRSHLFNTDLLYSCAHFVVKSNNGSNTI